MIALLLALEGQPSDLDAEGGVLIAQPDVAGRDQVHASSHACPHVPRTPNQNLIDQPLALTDLPDLIRHDSILLADDWDMRRYPLKLQAYYLVRNAVCHSER